jgi:hypothetical protein
MQVVNRNRAIFDPDYLSLTQLDDYLVIVVIGGKEVYLDPGQKMCPFGLLHWKHFLASGLRMTDNEPGPVTTAAMTYNSSAVDRDANLTISSDGSVSGTIRCVLSGPDALYWRQLALENDQEEIKKRFAEAVQEDIPAGVHADFDHFLGLDNYNVNLIGVLKVTGNIGAATGKHFFLPGSFFQARAKHPFVAQDKRETPIDVRYPRVQQDDVTYNLPPGYTVESAPQAADASWTGFAILKASFNSTPDGVHLVRTLAYNFTLLAPSDYSSLRDFYQKVATADQQQLVLTRASAAKGN